jgi:hypothetical protein
MANEFSLGQKLFWLDVTESSKTAKYGWVAEITNTNGDYSYTMRDASGNAVSKEASELSDIENPIIEQLNEAEEEE